MTKLIIRNKLDTENTVTLWLDTDPNDKDNVFLMGYDDERICKLLIFDKSGKVIAPTGHGICGLRTDGNGRLAVDKE